MPRLTLSEPGRERSLRGGVMGGGPGMPCGPWNPAGPSGPGGPAFPRATRIRSTLSRPAVSA
eukprot:631737-Rhodomonas_salina.1